MVYEGHFEFLISIDLVHVGNFQFQIFIDLVLVSKMLIYATPWSWDRVSGLGILICDWGLGLGIRIEDWGLRIEDWGSGWDWRL